MTCAPGLATLSLVTALGAVPVPNGPDPEKAPRRALLVHLSPFDQGTVRRALDLALQSLASPDCPRVYADFELEGGKTPQDELDRRGMEPAELLETLVFMDGSREPVCREGRAAMITHPGSGVIRVCPLFTRLAVSKPLLAASLVVHESLHALGLGEDPPSSREITRAVEHRCRQRGRAASDFERAR